MKLSRNDSQQGLSQSLVTINGSSSRIATSRSRSSLDKEVGARAISAIPFSSIWNLTVTNTTVKDDAVSPKRKDQAVLVARMNWMQIEDQAKRDDRCVLPLGCVEQHAYLSLATDAILSERIAAEAAEPLGIPVFPVQAYGMTPGFTAYPGTISLRMTTYIALIEDLLDRGQTAGVFRSGVDPVQLYISVASLSYFYFSNHNTLATIFARDLLADAALEERRRHVIDVILGYLRP